MQGRCETDAYLRTSASVDSASICRSSAGFTLLELLLATFISALVIGILSVTLSVALRIWEKNRGTEPGIRRWCVFLKS